MTCHRTTNGESQQVEGFNVCVCVFFCFVFYFHKSQNYLLSLEPRTNLNYGCIKEGSLVELIFLSFMEMEVICISY